ncbi:MAG: protoporphyrinogen oxidase [Chloroflexi bacterium]|nr:protoporphyrinogen oxidase [Chloroflexota bacterium]
MNILIAVASRHGSTREIADMIAQELRDSGHAVEVHNADEVRDVERYDAAVVGSAVYMGSWLAEARRFVEQNRTTLLSVPVWLFSSGPLGEDPQPPGDPAHLDELMQATKARDHRVFVGKLNKSNLGFGERLAVKMVKAPEGDFRDHEAICGWAREIALALPPSTPRGD